MTIEQEAALAALRQLKVTVPARLIVGLHSVKLLEGVEISSAVSAAIERYLDGDVRG